MKLNQVKKSIEELNNSCLKSYQQINGLKLISMLALSPNDGEQVVHYDYELTCREFIEKEEELLFFIKKFLDAYTTILDMVKSEQISEMTIPNQELSYYFDAFVSKLSVMIESDQKDDLKKYFNKKSIESFYPSRNKYGLWWEVNMLRNRINHYTTKRYSTSTEKCEMFIPFSSRTNVLSVDKDNNIHLKTTLLDIYKIEQSKDLIEQIIHLKKRINLFDLLFQNRTANGHSKQRPYMIYPSKDIYFDYVDSGIRFLKEIFDFLFEINKVLYSEYLKNNNIEIKNKRSIIHFNDEEIIYDIDMVF